MRYFIIKDLFGSEDVIAVDRGETPARRTSRRLQLYPGRIVFWHYQGLFQQKVRIQQSEGAMVLVERLEGEKKGQCSRVAATSLKTDDGLDEQELLENFQSA